MIEREPVMDLLRKDLKKAEIAYRNALMKPNVPEEELKSTDKNLQIRRFILWTMDEFMMDREEDKGW